MNKDQIKELTLKVTQSNHSGLALILLEIEDIYINDALVHFEKDKEVNKYGEKCVLSHTSEYFKNLEQAKKVHLELMEMMERKDKTGKQVWKMLVDTNECIIKSIAKKRPYYLDSYLILNKFLTEVFEKVHSTDDEPPIMKNTHQVFAGLTYGRGTLNESIDEAKNANRGFFV